MDWQYKAMALNSLSPISIRMRGLMDWYVNQSTEIGAEDSGMLRGDYGNGKSPQEAIENHWQVLTDDLSEEQYIVINAGTQNRKHVRWNGFMWEDV